MTEAHKVCPICQAHNHRNATICVTCGATIAEVAPNEQSAPADSRAERYDYRLGETDLAEASLGVRGRILSGIVIALVLLIAGFSALAFLAPRLFETGTGSVQTVPTLMSTRMSGPSVTPGPPTATFTLSPIPSMTPTTIPTPTPCIQRVTAGDSLIAIVSRCGHSNLDILPTVMALNGIADETRLQIGQEIIVPLPSPTSDPAATAPPQAEVDARIDDVVRVAFDPLAPTATPTLLPGLMWHVVQPDENMIVIAVQYKTDAQTLSEVNPEIEFLLCDYSSAYGGPECTVNLSQGQKVRVPAPTATTTPIPTASGSETPTPLPSATFNAPIAQSPPDQAVFNALEQITLRWVATGTLAQNEVFRIVVQDIDSGAVFTTDTREHFFIIPAAWQALDDARHNYSWQVSVIDTISNSASHATEIRTFVWQGTGQAE